MDEDDRKAILELLKDANPSTIGVSSYGTQAYELARAMFVVLSREKGPEFPAAVRDELARRAGELADCGHPWEEEVAEELYDTQTSDIWHDVGISGNFPPADD